MSRAIDVDGDGYLDLIVVNAENGITSELDSYIYWGGPKGLTGDRSHFSTVGAYDVAAIDLTGNGLLDIIFPSAWVDHHNPGRPRLIQVYEQVAPRRFKDARKQYGLNGVAAISIACEDLNADGKPELVVANYRKEFEYDTESFLYSGREDGFDTNSPLGLPTHYAAHVPWTTSTSTSVRKSSSAAAIASTSTGIATDTFTRMIAQFSRPRETARCSAKDSSTPVWLTWTATDSASCSWPHWAAWRSARRIT